MSSWLKAVCNAGQVEWMVVCGDYFRVQVACRCWPGAPIDSVDDEVEEQVQKVGELTQT